jgi:hypothetical protein
VEIGSYKVDGETQWKFYYEGTIGGWNIADIQIQAKQNIPPEIQYSSTISIVPSDVQDTPMTHWDDNTVEPKQKVTDHQNFNPEWQSCGGNITYHYTMYNGVLIPTSASIIITANPKIITANLERYEALRRGRISAEDIDFGVVTIAFKNNEEDSPFRISYSYEEQSPLTHTAGSGAISRTVTDTSYKIVVDNLASTNNTNEILTNISIRADAELAKVNQGGVNGRVTVVGDETLDLRTLVSVGGYTLDVVRVVHDFNNGFTTQLELTNEKFRVNVPTYKQKITQSDEWQRTKQLQDMSKQLEAEIRRNRFVAVDKQDGKIEQYKHTPFSIYGD